jgi:alanine racemase
MTYSDTAVLTIDLAALTQNYQAMKTAAKGAQTAAVVKANAYGLGLAPIVQALSAAGCSHYFVALAQEGIELRALLPEAVIYVLNGLPEGAAADFAAHKLRPCLAHPEQISQWQDYCQTQAKAALPACLFVDTGFNRLGLSPSEVADLADTPEAFEGWELCLIASHLACADTPEHPQNAAQLEAFRFALSVLPDAPASLANSGGVCMGEAYHFDMVRVGTMVYGGSATGRAEDALAPVACLRAPLLQIRQLSAGDSIGYGATFTASREMTLGIVSLGYGDGLSRYFSGKNGAASAAHLLLHGQPMPLVGRISMDSLAVDMTDLPASLRAEAKRGDMVEIFGPNNSIDRLAMQGQTISYELLTALGNRYKRIYSD